MENNRPPFNLLITVVVVSTHDYHLKKMPGEPGEMEAMRGAILGWVSQGLQHEVIAMASCCKKGGGQ